MIDRERPRWKWTYHDISTPWVTHYGDTYVGWWASDDDRDPYKDIRAGQGFRGPEFGHPSTFPRRRPLKEAIAFSETYLAKDARYW
jgi:hypothetical protein